MPAAQFDAQCACHESARLHFVASYRMAVRPFGDRVPVVYALWPASEDQPGLRRHACNSGLNEVRSGDLCASEFIDGWFRYRLVLRHRECRQSSTALGLAGGFGAALVARLNVSATNRVPTSSLNLNVNNRGRLDEPLCTASGVAGHPLTSDVYPLRNRLYPSRADYKLRPLRIIPTPSPSMTN